MLLIDSCKTEFDIFVYWYEWSVGDDLHFCTTHKHRDVTIMTRTLVTSDGDKNCETAMLRQFKFKYCFTSERDKETHNTENYSAKK